MSILYPEFYLDKITDININFLEKNNIKGLILDVDNTLIDYDLNILQGLDKWFEGIKSNGIKTMIVSNTNKEKKVKLVADFLGIDYILFAHKPLKRGLLKAKNILNIDNNNIAVIGDQIFTDVWGANRCKMRSILLKPIDKKDIWLTKVKRPLERYVIKKYLKEKEEKQNVHK